MKITLDNNCIIALDENDANALYIRKLISLHEDKKITLRLATISASERQRGGRYAAHFAEFQERIIRLGLAHIETLDDPSVMLKHPAHWGMSYWGQATYGDDTTVDFERKIHEILFPDDAGEFDYHTYCLKHGLDVNNPGIDRNWRNKRCDVLGLWSHIHYKGDIFVTADKHFLAATKRPKLIALGSGDILAPKDAVENLRSL